jgi:hypothetical protein
MTPKPERIQRKRTKGWRMPPDTIYVGRPSEWGNPFTVGEVYFDGESFFHAYGHLMKAGEYQGMPTGEVTVENCLILFRAWCEKYMELGPGGYWIERLRGKDLACWCKQNAPCHADILLELANQ